MQTGHYVNVKPEIFTPHGFIAAAVGFAKHKGEAAYVGDGSNRWPAVHRDDAAHLFRLALESAPPRSVLHAVGEEAVTIGQVAETIAAGLGIASVSVPAEQADDYVSWLGRFWALDGPATAAATSDLLDWRPTHPGLIADLEAGRYFS